jgi:hypothetical protein
MSARVELGASLGWPIVSGLGAAFCVGPLVFAPGPMKGVPGAILVALAVWAVRLARRRLEIDDEGVRCKTALGRAAIGWTEVSHYTFWSGNPQFHAELQPRGALARLLALTWTAAEARRHAGPPSRRFSEGRLRIVARDGRRIAIDARYKRPAEAVDAAFEHLHARLRGVARPDYVPFALGDGKLLLLGTGSVPLSEVERVQVAGGTFVVRRRGTRSPWGGVAMGAIHNGLLLLEQLAERGVVVDVRDMFLPASEHDRWTREARPIEARRGS